MVHPAQLDEQELLKDCEIRRQRRSGPGGQHRNKVETGIFVIHQPTDCRAEACEKRSQAENQAIAIHRLRIQLALSHRESPADERGQLWQQRVRNRRLNVSVEHSDFPSMLAELFDYLPTVEYSLGDAGAHFGVSASQLVKFLKAQPQAFVRFNELRTANGQKPLR